MVTHTLSHGNLKNIVMDLKALLSPIKPKLAQKKEFKKCDSTFPESWSAASTRAPMLHTVSDTPQLMTEPQKAPHPSLALPEPSGQTCNSRATQSLRVD